MSVPLLSSKVGIGLRTCHYSHIETHKPSVPFFEVLSDNYFCENEPSYVHLQKIREHYPITLHGVGLSLGSTDPLNKTYLTQLKTLATNMDPIFISDHLCWTSFENRYFHELLPLPYTEEAIDFVAERICRVQDFLGRKLLIENVSTYLTFNHSTLTEWDFLQAVVKKADALILLDINNIYVSAKNTGFSTEDYLKALSKNHIAQFHLGGHEDHGTHLLDTHGALIQQEVWALYQKALHYFGPQPTVIERDNQIPTFEILWEEARIAQQLMDNIHNEPVRTPESIC